MNSAKYDPTLNESTVWKAALTLRSSASQESVLSLASHVLNVALKRLSNAWHTRYGPTAVLVETFVDRAHRAQGSIEGIVAFPERPQ